MSNYTWRTDAAHGEFEAESLNAAYARLVAEREWNEEGSAAEQRDIRDGAWLAISVDGELVLQRGEMP